MLYRENGQFKTNYRADLQIFPILQDRVFIIALLLAAIHLYQATLSPLMPRLGVGCRFTPTCSRYAEGAVRRDGALVGTARAVWRIARCGPWTPAGTHDPP
jgi:putative membrane protein insertion efficiency factor